jgi:RNA polymerase sigma-70 factor (ECF subfamily)
MTQKELFEHFHNDVYRTCYYMLRNRHDAEDLCQEVFVKVMQEDYNRIANLKAWILSITMNACRNDIRRRSRVSLGSDLMNWLAGRMDPRKVDEQIEEKERRADIALHIRRLRPKTREVIVLKYLHELKYEEIAAMLDIPAGTVKSRAHTGILQLREMMQPDRQAKSGYATEVPK